MTLKELFPRRKDWDGYGPYGYLYTFEKGKYIHVVVDITSTKRQHRTERILGPDSGYFLTNDGEYLFQLDLTDTNRALALIGIRSKWQE